LKKLFLLLVSFVSLFADFYYAKLEPYRYYPIKSSVSGEVIDSKITLEGEFVKNGILIKIDDELSQKEKSSIERKIKLLDDMIKINQNTLKNLEEIKKRKKENYEVISKLRTKSSIEKDREYYDYLSSVNSVFSIQEKIENYKLQINDLNYRLSQLNKDIKEKKIYVQNGLVYQLNVQVGDYVTFGTLLYTLADTSKGKLTLFLSKDELDSIDKKVIYIDDIKTNLKIDKIWDVADSVHISAYRTEILIDNPKRFSVLKKVEFKNE